MEILSRGIPSRLNDVPNGECFSFESGNQIAIGIKIAYQQSPNSRVLVLTRDGGQPPSLQRGQEANPTIIYRQSLMAVVTDVAPSQLRNGVANPWPGSVIQLETDVYLGFLDEYGDPSAVSLKTGLINPNPIDGQAAVFSMWRIVFNNGEEITTVFSYKPVVTERAA